NFAITLPSKSFLLTFQEMRRKWISKMMQAYRRVDVWLDVSLSLPQSLRSSLCLLSHTMVPALISKAGVFVTASEEAALSCITLSSSDFSTMYSQCDSKKNHLETNTTATKQNKTSKDHGPAQTLLKTSI
ncbi:hypothetical protein H1C71_004807, partial [Ictidomys tridecemlineatus]